MPDLGLVEQGMAKELLSGTRKMRQGFEILTIVDYLRSVNREIFYNSSELRVITD